MQTVEFSARSVQEAKSQAAYKLGVAADQVQITVLEETKGLFGKSSVRVRAEVAAPAPVAVVAAPAIPTAPATPVVKGGRGGRKAPVAEVAAVVVAEPEPVAPAAEPAAKPDPRRGRGRKPAAETEAVVAEATETAAPAEETGDVVASQRDADVLVALVRELMEAAQLSVNAEIESISGRYVNISLDGKDVAFIVGKHGEVLNAMQYLVNIVAGRRIERGVRATLDGNDYRRRREEALTQLAQRIAEQVKKRGEEAVLDALPAFERRIVHKALGEISGITTYSEGEEPNRRVVIAPAD